VAAVALALGVFGLAAPVSAQDGESVTVELEEENDSGVTGTVVLTADGDQTTLTVELVGGEEGFEGHMFDSTCDDHRSATIFYAIEPVDEDGFSESVVDAPLSELTTGDYWIHMHRPAGEQGEGVACGQVPVYEGTGGNLPSTGVGPLGGDGPQAWLIVGLMAALGAFGASTLLRRPGPVRG
jgi:hypothetical protein